MSNGRPAKRALIIGINKYPNLAPAYQLSGCANDARLLAGILRDRFGFPAGEITLLIDDQATQARIRAEMEALAAKTRPDDMVVLAYSGHGSQMTDREGDEADGMDETIVPHDSGRGDRPNRDISDDEIFAWLGRLAPVTPYVTLIFDCCHSGTIGRDAFGEASRWAPPDRRPISELPPSPLPAGATGEGGRDPGGSGWLPLSESYVLIAGCSDGESSYEYRANQGGRAVVHGALTYFLAQELVAAAAGAAYRDVFERVAPLVTAARSRQHPQLEGARDRVLFGVTDAAPGRFVAVTARKE